MSSLSSPGALRPEQDAAAQVTPGRLVHRQGGGAGGHHRLDDVAVARAGGEHPVQVRRGIGHGRMQAQRVEDPVGARSGAPRTLLRPAHPAGRPGAGGTARHWPCSARPPRYCRPVAGGRGSRRGCRGSAPARRRCRGLSWRHRGTDIHTSSMVAGRGVNCRHHPGVPTLDLHALPFDSDAMLAGLRPWVECESPTWDAAAVNRMMDLASADLAALGATIDRIPGTMGLGDCVRARFGTRRTTDGPGVLVLAPSGHGASGRHPGVAAVPAGGGAVLRPRHLRHEGRHLRRDRGDPPAQARRVAARAADGAADLRRGDRQPPPAAP